MGADMSRSYAVKNELAQTLVRNLEVHNILANRKTFDAIVCWLHYSLYPFCTERPNYVIVLELLFICKMKEENNQI